MLGEDELIFFWWILVSFYQEGRGGINKKTRDLRWKRLLDSFKTHQNLPEKNSFIQNCEMAVKLHIYHNQT